jgi:predicted SprT family Zn-dependent metalloprotease
MSMLDSELDAYAHKLLDDLMDRHPMKRRPDIVWKGLRVSAGLAYFRTNTIGLSLRLLTNGERLRATLVHEYSHLLAVERHGRKAIGHGEHWKRTMVELGEEPKRTHCYQVERNATRQQVTYACARCGKTFQKSRRFPKKHRYFHINCGGDLKLVRVERATIQSS